MVVSENNVDPEAFLSFLILEMLDLYSWRYKNRCFLVALCHLIVRRPKLRGAIKRFHYQQAKMPKPSWIYGTMLNLEVHPHIYFWFFGYSWSSLVVIFYSRWVLSEGCQNCVKDKCISPDAFVSWETNLRKTFIWLLISLKGYFSLSWKDSASHVSVW